MIGAPVKLTGFGALSGSDLKIIACIIMTIDHVGIVLFPQCRLLRIVGRLAFPIFAFLIAEGCRYTKNRAKRLFTIAALGLVCAGAYYIYAKRWEGSILITFSFSIALIFLLQEFKKAIFTRPAKPAAFVITGAALVLGLLGAYHFNRVLGVDYGFLGILVPVLVSLFDFHGISVPEMLRRLDCFGVRLLCLAAALVLLCSDMGPHAIQWFCLLALPIVWLYNGKPGNKKLKYFFYVFYPVHLLIIEGLNLII